MLHRIVAPALLVTSFSLSAVAQTPPPADPGMPQVPANSPSGWFGGKGQLAILAEAGVVFSHTSISGRDGSTTLVLRPAVDYFVIDHLSIGAFTGVSYEKAAGASATTYAIGPRVGYDIPFTARFSVWPKAGLSYNSTKLKSDTPPVFSDTNSAIALNLFVPVMFHTNHYFVGFGPGLDRDLSGDAKATTFAFRLNVGGWLF